MKRLLTKRNKAKYSKLVKWAKEEDLGLHNLLQVLTAVQEVRQAQRIANRHGTQEDWHAVELSSSMVCVPIVSCKDRRILSYAAYFSVDMLPEDKKAQYGTHFDDMDTAEGMLTDIIRDETVTDEESRDSAINQKPL